MKLSALILIVVFLTFARQAHAQDKWQIADEATVRLKPTAFSQLPKNIVVSLQRRNCTVPQTFSNCNAAQCASRPICPKRTIRLGNFVFAEPRFLNPGFLEQLNKVSCRDWAFRRQSLFAND